MTFEIGLTFGILLIAVLLFVTEAVRLDLTALGVLAALALTGLVTADQAIAGFSNPAVITIWAMYILSAGLARTGVSVMLGNQIMRFAKGGDGKLTSVLMAVTAILSSFMNNTGVAAMFLPITVDIARRTGRQVSKLLLPMAYGSLLGGVILLIGTSSNLLIRDALNEAGVQPFEMFDFTIGGLVILAFSVAYMGLVGRRFLPTRDPIRPLVEGRESNGPDIRELYSLEERLAYLVVPDESPLAGKTLGESRIGRALGLNVLSIRRRTGQRIPADPGEEIRGGDRLLILGRLDRIEEIAAKPVIEIEDDADVDSILRSSGFALAEGRLEKDGELLGTTIADMAFRTRFGVNVLAICCGDRVDSSDLQSIRLSEGDRLLLQGSSQRIDGLAEILPVGSINDDGLRKFGLSERLIVIRVPEGSALAERTLKESRLGAAFGLDVFAVEHENGVWEMPENEAALKPGDRLLVGGRPGIIEILRGLNELTVDKKVNVKREKLEVGSLRVVEVMLSPYTSLAGKTLSEIRFRDKYGVSVLAIWRGDRPYRTELGDIELSFGDALLCYGPRDRFELMARDHDFVVLKAGVQEEPRTAKAPLAALIMVAVVAAVMLFSVPIPIAAISGSVLMIASRCLSMDEAYQAIDWKAVFLIAAMLPLGAAMGSTGAATLLAGTIIGGVGGFGPTAVLAGLMIFSILCTQTMPSAVVAVLMSPIALTTASAMDVSPYPFMMGVAYALAASFLSPVAHPANILVMSPGGYRFSDYIVNGLPISVIVVVISVLLLPFLFPF